MAQAVVLLAKVAISLAAVALLLAAAVVLVAAAVLAAALPTAVPVARWGGAARQQTRLTLTLRSVALAVLLAFSPGCA